MTSDAFRVLDSPSLTAEADVCGTAARCTAGTDFGEKSGDAILLLVLFCWDEEDLRMLVDVNADDCLTGGDLGITTVDGGTPYLRVGRDDTKQISMKYTHKAVKYDGTIAHPYA